jgi:hypothetical protein
MISIYFLYLVIFYILKYMTDAGQLRVAVLDLSLEAV